MTVSTDTTVVRLSQLNRISIIIHHGEW